MKKHILPILLSTVASMGLSRGALSVPVGGLTVNFTAAPAGGDFYSVPVAGAGGNFAILGTDPTGIDHPTTGLGALLAVPATQTDWSLAAYNYTVPATIAHVTNAQVRYASTGRMLTGPTGNSGHALIGSFTNGAGGPFRRWEVKFDAATYFASAGTGAPAVDPLAGLHLYASTTGLANSWTRIGGPFLTGTITQTIGLTSALPAGGSLFVAFFDDNGPGSGTPNFEGDYTIDNIVITPRPDIITPVVSAVVRNDNGTPRDAADDTVDFTLAVTATDPAATTWTISKPGTASLDGQTGDFTTPKNFTALPIADIAPSVTFAVQQTGSSPVITANATVAVPICLITPAYSNLVYNDAGTVTDFGDDEVTYNVTADAVWGGTDYVLDVPVATAPYTTITAQPTVTVTNAPRTHNFVDSADVNCTARLVVNLPQPIGTYDSGAGEIPLFSKDSSGLRYYTTDRLTSITTHVSGVTVAADYVLESTVLDLSAVGGLLVTAELEAQPRTGGSGSGFEAVDFFSWQAIIDGGTPVSMLGASDLGTPDGKLSGATGAGTELPGTTATLPKVFTFSFPIPPTANSLQLRSTINSNSPGETLILKNVKIVPDGPRLTATSAGPVTRDNKGTVTATDDMLVAPIILTPTNGAGTGGWTSDLVAPDGPQTGAYGAAAINFSVATPKTVLVTDDGAPTATAQFAIAAPTPTLMASLAAGSILRNENGPGPEDDTVTFTLNVASTNAGPEFTATVPILTPVAVSGAGVYPVGGTTTMTLSNLPNGAVNVVVTIADASYQVPPAAVNVTIAIPAPATAITAVMGQKNFGPGFVPVLPATTPAPAASWVNYASVRSYVMTTGAAADAKVESETLDLSTIGEVQFTAKFRAADNSAGSNFEIGDKFKAELFIDGSATPVALLPAGSDVGDGSPSHLDPGTNGAPNGYLNGFNGVAPVAPATVTTDFLAPNATYLTAAEHYFGNKVRDEFNALGQPVTASLDNTFNLSYTIPAGANSVKLVIYGAGASGSESFTVKDVLFVGSADPDADLDGMSDSYETTNGLQVNVNDAAGDLDGDGISNLDEFRAGTTANDPNSALRILSIVPAATAGQHTVTWSSVAGKSYQLEESSDLGPTDAWVNFGAPVSAAGATTSFTGVLPGAGRHFVRVKVR